MSRLILQDNIRASAVCKSWLQSAVSVRVVDLPPRLLHVPKTGDKYEILDPSDLRKQIFELPELNDCLVRYSNDGWLLMQNPSSDSLFFFNPFTRNLINLPTLENTPFTIAFSSAPTSGNCWLFTVSNLEITHVKISTLHVGKASEWTTETFESDLPFNFQSYNQIMFCKDRFYCLSRIDWIAAFDPLARSWDVLKVPSPGCPYYHFNTDEGWQKFMTEHEGEIFVIYSRDDLERPIVFRLDIARTHWRNEDELEGLTIFTSSLSSKTRFNLADMFKGKVCSTKGRFFRVDCDQCSNIDGVEGHGLCNECREQWPRRFIWIDPPREFRDMI
ncbi:PREDICTED: F-box protein At3g56470-like [Tarenaya hassleriana]|uniref:F-box protein At3g56470-like n=1 Tax=Tarenaya hassleriana TaxID=28532 RepID=UPI00053C9189|nr:PREDICTED: F-box protein At3g56470-like [Tarenaya hassleriana]